MAPRSPRSPGPLPISSASYVVSLIPPQIVRELQPAPVPRASIIDPDYWCPFPDGSSLTLWGDAGRTADEIRRFSKGTPTPTCSSTYFERVGRLLRDLLFVVPPNLTIRELPRWLGVGRKLRHWTAGTSPRPFACSRSVAPTSSTSGSRTNG